ncbi:MAG: hypothetical protein AAGC55_05140, partial [Myxococcota bacterium]
SQPERSESVRHDPVICVISVLAPVYAIYVHEPALSTSATIHYADFPTRYHERIGQLSALIEEMFGFVGLDEKTLHHPIPDVVPFSANFSMGEATLMDCLFTANP